MADDDWLAPGADTAPAADKPADLLEDGYKKPSSKKAPREKSDPNPIYKVWKRPVFFQYSYLEDYRHNYYDDVIDYLNLRQRGFSLDIPRPQTWAERALRTYTTNVRSSAAYERREKDISLLSDMRTCTRFYNYHRREYMSQ